MGQNDPTNSVKALKEVVVLSIKLQSYQVHLTMLQYHTCMQYTDTNNTYTKMNLSTVKWAQWDKTQSRELLGLFICAYDSLYTTAAHYIAKNRPDNFPSCPPDNHHCSDDVYLRERRATESRQLAAASQRRRGQPVFRWISKSGLIWVQRPAAHPTNDLVAVVTCGTCMRHGWGGGLFGLANVLADCILVCKIYHQLSQVNDQITFASPKTIYVSDAGLL